MCMTKKLNMLFVSRCPLKGFSNVNYNLHNVLFNYFNVDFKYLSLNLDDKLLFGLYIFKEVLTHTYLLRTNISINEYYKKILTNNDFPVKRRSKMFNKIYSKLTNTDVILSTFWEPFLTRQLPIPRCIYIDDTVKNYKKNMGLWSKYWTEDGINSIISHESLTYKYADLIFTFSEHVRKSLLDDYNISPRKVKTVYSGVNILQPPQFNKRYDGKTILFVGKDFHRKGGYTLLNAFKIVKRKIPDAKLYVVGIDKNIIESKSTQAGVEFLGFIERNKLLDIYKQASLFVLPSFSDPFPNVFFEAMVHKIPCIGTNVDRIPEMIIDNETGYIVPTNEPEILADRIVSILTSKDKMTRFGEKGYSRVKNFFTWEHVVKRIKKSMIDELNL